ncbi:LPS export ABC transporter periplasmic protein LptC [Sphingomonas sp. 28-63-12]|uniref:LPS export ABC transporter periplasmic protein LptC n=1 Tax=Sphingomonas sp. 28-63-12 TaxID=1970434 RepID=UPI000BD856D6|nr:MAG: LPS export ABC transporter periplasmic protein LptC [Sphingomonas sp. 28-63-12]
MADHTPSLRTARQLWAAPGGRHDRVVEASRVALPVMIGILTAFLVTAPLTMSGDVSFLLDKNKVEVAKERLRIQSALYRGADQQGRAFSLRAGSAVQKSSAEPVVKLTTLSAEMAMAEGPSHLRADSGRYDMASEKVMADGPIRFTAANGYDLTTRDATLDLKTRKLSSGGAVTGQVPQGSFSAARMSADLDSHVVTLDGDARLRIVPRRTR